MFALRLALLLPGLALAQSPAPAVGASPKDAPAIAAPGGAVEAPAVAAAPAAVGPAQPTTAPAYEDPAGLTALFHRRDDPALLAKLEEALDAGLKAKPEDFDLLWRKAQLRWNQADRVQGKARERLGKEAWELGARAAKARPERVEGHYWAAVGIGAYSQGVGLLAALTQGLEGRFNGFLDKAIQINPRYLDGAPVTAKGRSLFELPWPKRNLDKSSELLRQVTSRDPGNLRAWLFLAETELERGKASEAELALNKVLEGNGSYDPPEGRFVKQLARQLAPKINAKLKK